MKTSIPGLLFALLFTTTFALAQTSNIHTLHPPPKSAFSRSGYFALDMNTVIVTPDAYDRVIQSAALLLQRRVKETMGYTLPILPAGSYTGNSGAVLLGMGNSYPLLTSRLLSAMPPGETMPDSSGYILDISEPLVLIAGTDPAGVFSGVATLVQLIQAGNVVARMECAHIRDYPDYPIRWVFSQHNLLVAKSLTSLRSIADTMTAYKLNGLQQNDFKYNILDQMGVNYIDNVEALQRKLDSSNIELIPGVANIGWSEGILYHDPNLAEGLPAVATFIMEGDTGRLIPDPQVSLPNGDFESVDGSGKFTGWSFYDGAGVSAFPDHTVVHGGSTSARCTDFSAGNPSGNCRFNRRVDCQPYHYYTMSAWLKTEDFTADLVQLLAIGQNDNGDSRSLTSMSVSVPATTNGWMKIEVVFNTVGYNHVQLYAGCWGGTGGTIWWDDFRIQEAGLTNILRREGTPLRIRNPETGANYREGVDFAPVVDSILEASHGVYGPYHKPPTLRRIPSGILANGDTVTVSFFHPIAAVSDAQGNGSTMVCVSEDTLYDILSDQISRVNHLYNPDAFFMGHDEVRTMNWDSACQHRKLTPGDLLADNLVRCDSIIQLHHPGARSYVWSDMFDSLHNAHDRYYMVNGNLAGDWNRIPTSVTIVNWNGGNNRDKSLHFFADHGFRQVTSPYYDVKNTSNMRAWRLSQQNVSGVEGMMYTTWGADYSFLRPFAYYVWGAGPYLIHIPIDSNLVAAITPGDSVLIEATIYPDPYDAADGITSAVAQILGSGATVIQEEVKLVHTSGNQYAGYAHTITSTQSFDYSITAVNRQGLARTTPTYHYSGIILSGIHEENVPGTAIAVVPNPFMSSAVVTFTVPQSGVWRLRLVDMLGREVYDAEGEVSLPVEKQLTIDAEALTAGTYQCEVTTPRGTSTAVIRIVK